MSTLRPVVAILCFMCVSCSYLKNVRLLTEGEIKREKYVETIPFEWRKDLIVVKARLNSDTTEREFIFDTGAFNSKIESILATSLGLEVVTHKMNSTAQGISQRIEVVRIDSLQLGETTVYNLGAGKLRYAPTSASPCVAGHGILGANLIKLAHWKIDYGKQLLHFSDMPFEVEEGSFVVPFDRPLLSGTPTIDLDIEGKKVENVLFDVGYNGGLVLPLSLAKHFNRSGSSIILDRSTSGIYGTNSDSLIVKDLTVNVGGLKTNIPVAFSMLNKALLGNEFLKHFTVIINYDRNKIYLQKLRDVYIAPQRDFLVGIENDSTWVVIRTTPEVPLHLGESLRTVNEKRPDELFRNHCDYVMNSEKLYQSESLSIQKMDGSKLNVSMK